MISMRGTRRGMRARTKTDANSELMNDKQLQNLLDYFGLGRYPGLISLLRKLGSGGSSTMMIFISPDIPWVL